MDKQVEETSNSTAIEKSVTGSDAAAPQAATPGPQVASKPSGLSSLERTAPTEKLKLHEEQKLVPEMREEEYRELLEDVRVHGIRTPIEVDVDGVTILDGKHRLQVAQELMLTEVPIRFARLGTDKPREFIVKMALLRRHLTDDQRKMLAAYLADANSKRGGDRRSERAHANQTDPTGGGLKGKAKDHPALADAAKALSVTVTGAVKAKEVLNTDPELAAEGRAGKTSLSAARKQVKKKAKAKPRSSPSGASMDHGTLSPADDTSTLSFLVQKQFDAIGARLTASARELRIGFTEATALLNQGEVTFDDSDGWGDWWVPLKNSFTSFVEAKEAMEEKARRLDKKRAHAAKTPAPQAEDQVGPASSGAEKAA